MVVEERMGIRSSPVLRRASVWTRPITGVDLVGRCSCNSPTATPDGQITRAVDVLCRCTPERKRDTLELQLQHLAFLRCPFRGSRDPNSQLLLRNYWCEVQCTNYVTYSSSFELIGTLESLGAMLHVVPTNYSMDFLFGRSVAGVCIVLLNIRIHVCRSEGEEHSVNNTT